jgi:glucose-6-phosphate 1-dehydrogenase
MDGLDEILSGGQEPVPEKGLLVLGATGDMVSKRESRDALTYLAAHGTLTHAKNPVVLAGADDISVADYVKQFRTGDSMSTKLSGPDLDAFEKLAGLESHTGTLKGFNVTDAQAYPGLRERLPKPVSVLYAALPPKLYEPVLTNLRVAGLLEGSPRIESVVLEKPFGTDLKSAQALDELMKTKHELGQVLLIDHFLAYPGTLGMLAMRAWPECDEALSARYVESFEVRLTEIIKSNDRPYFRETGCVVDMVQSHGVLLLATLALDLPASLAGEELQKCRLSVLQGLRLKAGSARWGQFDGFNDASQGAPQGAKPSQAETYVAFDFSIDTDRWRGVPFRLLNGKGVHADFFGLNLQFRSLPKALAGKLGLQKDQPAHLEINARKAKITWTQGDKNVPVELDPRVVKRPPHALLLPDALQCQHGLFVSPEEALRSWEFIEELQAELRPKPLLHYAVGTEIDAIK